MDILSADPCSGRACWKSTCIAVITYQCHLASIPSHLYSSTLQRCNTAFNAATLQPCNLPLISHHDILPPHHHTAVEQQSSNAAKQHKHTAAEQQSRIYLHTTTTPHSSRAAKQRCSKAIQKLCFHWHPASSLKQPSSSKATTTTSYLHTTTQQ